MNKGTKTNPDCPLCHGYGNIVKDEFQKQAPACPLCYKEEMEKAKESKYSAAPSPLPLLVEGREKEEGLAGKIRWAIEVLKKKEQVAFTMSAEKGRYWTGEANALGEAVRLLKNVLEQSAAQLPVSDTGEKPERSPEALEAAARSKHSLSEAGQNLEVPDSGGPQMCMVHHALAFSAWTCENLWSHHNGNWYPYQDDDNPISGDELWKLWQNSANVQSDAWWVSLEAVKAKTKALQAEISSLKEKMSRKDEEIEASDILLDERREQLADRDTQIELLRKNGASLRTEEGRFRVALGNVLSALNAATATGLYANAKRHALDIIEEALHGVELTQEPIPASLRRGTSILDILKWAAKYKLRMYGAFFQRDYSSIGYTDETIVEDFLKDEANNINL